MKTQTQRRVVLKLNMKNLMTSLLPMVKKLINNKINQIKSGIMKKIRSNNLERDKILQKGYLIEQ